MVLPPTFPRKHTFLIMSGLPNSFNQGLHLFEVGGALSCNNVCKHFNSTFHSYLGKQVYHFRNSERELE